VKHGGSPAGLRGAAHRGGVTLPPKNSREWADLPAERTDSPEPLPQRLARALGRVARRVGLEEVPHA
jgi:hypothetical protein